MRKSRELKQDSSVQMARSIHEKLASITKFQDQNHSDTAGFPEQVEGSKKNIFEAETHKLEKISQMRKRGTYETAFATLTGCNKKISPKNIENLCFGLITDVSVMSKVLIDAEKKIVSKTSVIKTIKNESMPISFQLSMYLNSLGYYGQTDLSRWLKTNEHINEIVDKFVVEKTRFQPGIISQMRNSDYPNYTSLVVAEEAFKSGRYELAFSLFEDYTERGQLSTKVFERMGQILFKLGMFNEASRYFGLAALLPNASIVLDDVFSQKKVHVISVGNGRSIIFHKLKYFILDDEGGDKSVSSIFGILFVFSKETRQGLIYRSLHWIRKKLGRNIAGTTHEKSKLKTHNVMSIKLKFYLFMFLRPLIKIFVKLFMRGEHITNFIELSELIELQMKE